MRKLLLALLLVMPQAGCTDPGNPSERVDKRLEKDEVVGVPNEDKAMAAAIAEARRTVPEFIRLLRQPEPDTHGYAVKAPIRDGEHIEHFWLIDLEVTDKTFIGTINNIPQWVGTVKRGQRYTIAHAEISDWMYMKGNVMQGNRTLRAMFPYMDPEEVRVLKQRIGW